MVYVVQNYLASFGLYPSSGMWKFYKKPQRFGDWTCLRNVVVFCETSTYQMMDRVQKKPNSSVQFCISLLQATICNASGKLCSPV
jgi:hypothetical protein